MEVQTKPMLTIIMPTYNKKQYIEQALDSIFMQKTTYDYEIIVADDASNDGTLDIVHKYNLKYQNKIKILESKINQKLFKNIIRAYAITKTDYFCVLDPDDYWIDEYKIQKALDFLEANKEFTIYSANTNMLYSDGTKRAWIIANQKESNFKDYLQGKALLGHTSSCVFRNVIFKNGLPSKLTTLENSSNEVSYRGDSFRNIIHIHGEGGVGKAFFTPEIDSIYRITQEGIWQSLDNIKQLMMNCAFHRDMWLFFDKEYFELLHTSYQLYKKILQSNIFLENHDEFILNMNKLYDLGKSYQPYISQLDISKKPNTLKYKLFLSCYKFLHKKLAKKGYV